MVREQTASGTGIRHDEAKRRVPTMTTLTIVAERDEGLRPLIRSAIENEMRLLEAGARRTKRRIAAFEQQYSIATDDFLSQYESGSIQECLDFDEWIGEHRTLQRLRERQEALRGVRVED
jgi:hypothetical protein